MAKKPLPQTPDELIAAMQKEAEFMKRSAHMPGSPHAVGPHYRRAADLMFLAIMFMEGALRSQNAKEKG